MMKKSKPLLYDPLIVNRVKQYLEENVDQTYLDVGIMTKSLQDRYQEYARRKTAPFRTLVEQAYRIVSESYGMEGQQSNDDESDNSDLEMMDDAVPKNTVSNMMQSLYTKSKNPNATKGAPTAESIDIISSDEGEEYENGKVSTKTSSGTPTLPNVTITKIPITDQSAKSTTTAAGNGGSNTIPGQKRPDSEATNQPSKKPKTDSTTAPPQQRPLQTYRQHQSSRVPSQNQQLSFANFSQNSNDSVPSMNRQQPRLTQPLRARKYKKEVQLRKSRETFQDIGGMEKALKELCEMLMHIKSPDIYFVLGLSPPRGILLHGPPGCGKTLLAHAVAGQLNLPIIEIPATELIAGVSGESEERIRDIFEQAAAFSPCILFIDEIDAISSNRSNATKDMERRVVSQLISSLDSLKLTENGQSVLVIGATTRPDVLDPSLRRVGRFDHEIALGIPSRKDRKEILTVICDGLCLEPKFDYDKIAELTPGYVGADLLALVSRAATIAVKKKCSEQMRAFQAKAQRNITIVDLDDDDNAEDGESPSEDPDKTKTNESGKKTSEEGTLQATEQQQNDSKKSEKESEVTENGTAENQKGKQIDDFLKATDENQEADDLPNDETNDNEEMDESDGDCGDVSVATGTHEPTLFELLNWLDNPPEDITFVNDFCITVADFSEAVKVVQPSAKREGFITVPDVSWDDVGSLRDIREELKLAVLAPVKFPEKLLQLGLTAPSGVLLCGPPGCGKTLLAKAIANEAGINFISVKGPELMNMYVGESERAVRTCFQRARNSAPCVIFFDEFDSLCPKRSETSESSSGTRIVNQLLTEMDGVEDRQGVYILAATNRPDIIDPAILRPGRLDTVLYVGLPEEQDRIEILNASTKSRKRPVLADDVNFAELAKETQGYTGADLAGLVKQASMLALKESLNEQAEDAENLCVRKQHFDQAIKLLRPSVTEQDRIMYERLRLKYAAPREQISD